MFRSHCSDRCSLVAVQLAEALHAAAALVEAVLRPAAQTLALGSSFTVCGIEGGHGRSWAPRKGKCYRQSGGIVVGLVCQKKHATDEKSNFSVQLLTLNSSIL